MAETLREKISKHIYNRGVNTSSRERNVPADNDKLKDNPIISVINFGSDLDDGRMYIRASFHGSRVFYSVPIRMSDYGKWTDRIKSIVEATLEDVEDENNEIEF